MRFLFQMAADFRVLDPFEIPGRLGSLALLRWWYAHYQIEAEQWNPSGGGETGYFPPPEHQPGFVSASDPSALEAHAAGLKGG